jgi:peroxiredoxin
VPRLNALQERFGEEDLLIVGVTNEDEARVRATMESAGMRYGVALAPDPAVDRAYGVRAVPRSFLLDRQGRVVWFGHPAALDEQRIAELVRAR